MLINLSNILDTFRSTLLIEYAISFGNSILLVEKVISSAYLVYINPYFLDKIYTQWASQMEAETKAHCYKKWIASLPLAMTIYDKLKIKSSWLF